MEYTTICAVWAVAITGPCVISWLAGDMSGSTRTRQLYGGGAALGQERDAANHHRPGHGYAHHEGAFQVEAWRVPGTVRPLADAAAWEKPEGFGQRFYEEQAAEAERRRERRSALLMAPSQSGRGRVGDEPITHTPPNVYPVQSRALDPAHVLNHYQRSVQTLHRSDLKTSAKEHREHQAVPIRRAVLAEPVFLTTSVEELFRQRLRHS